MAEYHVGILNPKTKNGYRTWKDKSVITEEAISAVAQHLKQELSLEKNGTDIVRRFTFNDGTIAELKLSIVGTMNE